MAGRPKGSTGTPMTQEHRDKIANSKILNRLIRHAEGVEEMSQSEANTGLALLKKVMPDLKSIEHRGGEEDGSFGIVFKTILEK